MSSAKFDDGNKLMLKCQGGYIQSNSNNRTCEDPSTMESIKCPVDRNGQSLYTCFNMSGDQDVGCRSTCLHGHLQDFSRTLYNQDTAGAYPFYWEERGVELYENFGLSEDVRGGPGSYTYGSTDKNASDSSYGSYCSGSGIGGGTWPSCRNTCFTELGRKITLFGQVGFTCLEDWGSISQQSSSTTRTATGGFAIPSGYNTTYMNAHGNYYYVINFYKTAPNQGTDYIDQYDYFGNSGVIFKDANGRQYYFIYGIKPYIIDDGAKTYPTQAMLDYVLYDDSTRSLMISLKYFDTNASVIGIQCQKIPTATIIKPGNCTRLPGLDGIAYPAAAFPFPSNLNAQVFCDVGHSSLSNNLSTNANCYYSGVRSMYIPPHMKVTGFTHMEYVDQSLPWSSDYGSAKYNLVTKTGFKPFTYKDSPYKNGTFPSLGGVKANSPYDDSTSWDKYSAGAYTKGGAYTNPEIYNCSLAGIWVDVRRDNQFRSIYVPSQFYNDNFLYPEILLMPGIEQAQYFQANTTAKVPQTDPIQNVLQPDQLWTKEKNPYWDPSYSIELDMTKRPYDALPINPVVNAQATLAQIPSKIMPRMLSSVFGNVLSLPVKLHSKLNSFTATSFSGKPYIGQGRIKSFMPANGIMSIEWIYVIYRCAFSYQPGGLNNVVTYDPDSKNYVFGDNTNACGAECMLYRDPFYDGNTTSQTISASDIMMKTMCGAKTYMMAFAQYSDPTTNDCACVAALGYCPSQFNASSCGTSFVGQGQRYISDQNTDQNCDQVCSYCSTVTVQINMADQNSNLTDGVNSNNLGSTCAANPQCQGSSTTTQAGNGNTSGTTTPTSPTSAPDPPPKEDPDTDKKDVNKKKIVIIIFAIFMMVLIAIILFAAGVKYYGRHNQG